MKVFIDEQTGFLNLFEIRNDEAILTCTKLNLVAGSFRASADKPEFFWEYIKLWAATTNRVSKKSTLYSEFVKTWNLQEADFEVTDLNDEDMIRQIYKRASEYEQQVEFEKAARELACSGIAMEFLLVALRQYSIDTCTPISEVQRIAKEDPDELFSYIWGEWGYFKSVNRDDDPDDDPGDDPDCPPYRGPEILQ